MLKIVDRTLGILLLIGGVLHGLGSFKAYASSAPLQVWALSGSVAALLLAAINLLRVDRPADRALAWVSLAGCIAWIAVAIAFGLTLDSALDPRVLYHVIVTVGLAAFSLNSALRRRG
jgi:uncharacterized membrane protein HdeD (DUF308 family)